MKTYLFLAMMLLTVILVHTAYAIVPLGGLVVAVKPEKSPLLSSEIPVIVGTVTNQAGRPVSDVQVIINTSYGSFVTTTDNDGKFRYQYSNPIGPAQYLVTIKALKTGFGTAIGSTTFFVKGMPVSQPSQYNFKTVSGNNTSQDPVASKILKSIAIAKQQQAEQDAKLKQIAQEQSYIQSQRALADQQLQFDLGGWFAQLNPFTPRNAYAAFVTQVNQTVQSIFWGQFNFTEQKTNQGLVAKNLVLQNGGSNDQARIAFIQNATTHRSEISQVNNDLNVKYANANKTVQAKFDKYGNLPRS